MDSDRAAELLRRERSRIEDALANLGRDRAQALADEDEPGETDSEGLLREELDAGFADDLAGQLEALERAEARLAAGTYGVSIESGETIPDERLEAVPTAERTVEEQRLHDQRN